MNDCTQVSECVCSFLFLIFQIYEKYKFGLALTKIEIECIQTRTHTNICVFINKVLKIKEFYYYNNNNINNNNNKNITKRRPLLLHSIKTYIIIITIPTPRPLVLSICNKIIDQLFYSRILTYIQVHTYNSHLLPPPCPLCPPRALVCLQESRR
jgi:hypothetical protein